MAPHSSTLAWKIPWTEEPGRLQSMASLRVGHDWVTERLHVSLSCIGEGNGNPLQCSCLENPRDSGVWWVAVYGSHRVRHNWSDLEAAAPPQRRSCQNWIWEGRAQVGQGESPGARLPSGGAEILVDGTGRKPPAWGNPAHLRIQAWGNAWRQAQKKKKCPRCACALEGSWQIRPLSSQSPSSWVGPPSLATPSQRLLAGLPRSQRWLVACAWQVTGWLLAIHFALTREIPMPLSSEGASGRGW